MQPAAEVITMAGASLSFAKRERTVALESEIVCGGAVALVESDDRLSCRHAERVEDAFPIYFRKSAGIKRHQQVAKQVESHVVVVKLLAGRVSGAMFGGRVAEEDRRCTGTAGGVGEQVMRGDWFVGGFNAEPTEIIPDRLVQVDLAFVAQLKQAECDKAFANGANLKELIGIDQ